jgi:hypothetical protein
MKPSNKANHGQSHLLKLNANAEPIFFALACCRTEMSNQHSQSYSHKVWKNKRDKTQNMIDELIIRSVSQTTKERKKK